MFRKRFWLPCFLVLVIAFSSAGFVSAGEATAAGGAYGFPAGQSYVAGEILVRYNDSLTSQEKVKIKDQHGLRCKKELLSANTELVQIIGGQSVEQVIARLKADSRIACVQPNYWYTVQYDLPDDEYFGLEWGLENSGQIIGGSAGIPDIDIDAPETWPVTKGSSDILVAIIDTGIDISHPDLAANIWTNAAEANGQPGVDDDQNGYVDDIHGWDFFNGDATVYDAADGDDHGTHCAGTIGAVAGNGIGVAGVAPGVKIMSLKFIGPSGGSTADAIEALDYARHMGADLTSMNKRPSPDKR